MKNNTERKIIGVLSLSNNISQINILDEYLQEFNWTRIVNTGIVFDAMPTHLILYTNMEYDFVFEPKFDEALEFVNTFEFENFIISKTL